MCADLIRVVVHVALLPVRDQLTGGDIQLVEGLRAGTILVRNSRRVYRKACSCTYRQQNLLGRLLDRQKVAFLVLFVFAADRRGSGGIYSTRTRGNIASQDCWPPSKPDDFGGVPDALQLNLCGTLRAVLEHVLASCGG